jgi:hypothetical protein
MSFRRMWPFGDAGRSTFESLLVGALCVYPEIAVAANNKRDPEFGWLVLPTQSVNLQLQCNCSVLGGYR